MHKLKLYQFALALAGVVLISAATSKISTAYAAPAAAAVHVQDVVDSNAVEIQRRRYRRSNRWVGPAVALGVFGAIAGIAANQQYYDPYYQRPYAQPYGYYQGPYAQPYGYYYQQPRRRCYVVTDPVMLRGYYTWC